jgi:hypothetical protein
MQLVSRSFGLVDDKLFEADFFLDQLLETRDFFAARCYFSAFVAAGRSVTFALQACLADVPGFAEWHAGHQARLRADPIAQFFQRTRTESQHIGLNPLRGGTFAHSKTRFFLRGSDAPEQDAHSASRRYMSLLVNLVHDCYQTFGTTIDPDQYYTLDNLAKRGMSIEDVEEELGFPRGWTDVPAGSCADRLHVLRREIPMTSVSVLFDKYPSSGRAIAPRDD